MHAEEDGHFRAGAARAEHLIETVGHEDELIGSAVVEEPIVIAVDGIAVPMAGENFHGEHFDEAIHVEQLIETGPLFGGRRLVNGGDELFELGMVVGKIAGIQV